jgi:hypothetical protein
VNVVLDEPRVKYLAVPPEAVKPLLTKTSIPVTVPVVRVWIAGISTMMSRIKEP